MRCRSARPVRRSVSGRRRAGPYKWRARSNRAEPFIHRSVPVLYCHQGRRRTSAWCMKSRWTNGGYVTGTRLELIYHPPKLCTSSLEKRLWRPSGRRSRSRRLRVLQMPTGWPCPRCGEGLIVREVWARRRGGRSKSACLCTSIGTVRGDSWGEAPRVADSSAAGAGRVFHNSSD